MKISRSLPLFALALLLGACTPTEPPAPIEAPRDEVAERRAWLFGPAAAAAKDITWRESGLGIRLLAPGTGASPAPTDRIRVNYVAKLKDGTVVDDSQHRGKPSDFVLNQLISGWAEGMAALKPGGRAEFFIPPSLGYGNMGGGGLPAGAGLIFEVELLAVNPPPVPKS